MTEKNKTNVLLLGGSGYLGSQIKHELGKENTLTIISTYRTSLPQNSTNFIQLDINDPVQVQNTLKLYKPDVVIWSLMSDNEDILINKGLDNLLSYLPKSTKLIFISTDGVFSQGTGNFTEDDVPQVLDSKNPLSINTNAKIFGEEKIRKNHPNSLIIRFGPIYGMNVKGVLDGRTTNLLLEWETSKKITKPTNLYKSFIHVEDLSKSIVELAKMKYMGILHLGPLSKENYYSFSKKRLANYGKDPSYILEELISKDDAINRAVPLDTSLNTVKANNLLNTKFRKVMN